MVKKGCFDVGFTLSRKTTKLHFSSNRNIKSLYKSKWKHDFGRAIWKHKEGGSSRVNRKDFSCFICF